MERIKRFIEKRLALPRRDLHDPNLSSNLNEVGNRLREVRRYGVVQSGALKYLTDTSGHIVSEGYHDFEVFKVSDEDVDIQGLVGRVGSAGYALRPPMEEDPFFRPSQESFHEIEYRKDLGGRFVTSEGAMSFLVDANGRRITTGHHRFYIKDGRLYGITGTVEELININEQAQLPYRLQIEGPK